MRSTLLALLLFPRFLFAQDTLRPSRTEIVTPIHTADFTNGNSCPERKMGGNPRQVNGLLVFDGSTDGNRQVDPQVAVGGGFVMEASNSGLMIFDKQGKWLAGVSQKCFNNGIDPKLVYDLHNKVFLFDLWWYYDKPKTKPVNVAVSETSDPTKAWNIYPVSRTEEEDGGAIGYSRKWIGYSYPGGEENTFVLRTAEAKSGKPATVYHFKGSLGLPVFGQDATDDMYFVDVDSADITVRRLTQDKKGEPIAITLYHGHHGWTYFDYPPSSPQKDTTQVVASGDRNPKNLVLQNGSIWFSQAVLCEGRSAVQWHQLDPKSGKFIQSGLIRSDTSSFIQTSVAVNKKGDLLVGFQETSAGMYISPRLAYRKAGDKKGTLRPMIHIGEGEWHTNGESWGDYSGGIIDGDNLMDLWTIQSRANKQGRAESVIARMKR